MQSAEFGDDDNLLLGAMEEEAMAQQFGDFDTHSLVGTNNTNAGSNGVVPSVVPHHHIHPMMHHHLVNPLLPLSLTPAMMNPLMNVQLHPPLLQMPSVVPGMGNGVPSLHHQKLLMNTIASSSMNDSTFEEDQDTYEVIDDDKQEPTEFPTLAQEDVTNEQRLDEILSGVCIHEEQERMKYYMANGVKYPFVAQWRNPLIHSIRENVIVKHVVDFNPYFGIVVIVEPLYLSNDKKKKKTTVSNLRHTGYYVHAADLYGMKKKSVIGRLLDDHRKYLKRCALVNQTKASLETHDVAVLKTKCEMKIPKINEITNLLTNMTARLKGKEDPELLTVVNRYESQGGNPPQKLNKKIDVSKSLEIDDTNERITSLCPPGTGSINDLPTLVRYATVCCKFPFEAKVTSLYSFLNEQQVEFVVQVNSVNYRCKQGIIFKATVSSGRLEPIDSRFKVHGSNSDLSDEDYSDEEHEPNRKKRKVSNFGNIDSFNTQSIKVDSCRLRFENPKSVNFKVLADYQSWFCNSTLLDEKKIDDQWNNLRFYLQFIE